VIKRIGKRKNLRALSSIVSIIDQTPSSKNYFRLSEFPDRLGRGKNLIKINANDSTLAPNSQIYIEIVDSEGNPIYHEVLDYIGKDKSRLIAVYVYDDTAPGEFYAYIAGRATYNQDTGETIPHSDKVSSPFFKDNPNLLWVGTGIVVPNKSTQSEPFFLSQPRVTFKEVLVPYKEPVAGSRYSSSLYSVVSGTLLIDTKQEPPLQFRQSIESTTVFDSDTLLIKNPTSQSVIGGQSTPSLNLPNSDLGFSYVSSSGFSFNKDMEGGSLHIKTGSIVDYLPNNISNISQYSTYISNFSASIVRVESRHVARIYPPFVKDVPVLTTNSQSQTVRVKNIKLVNGLTHEAELTYFSTPQVVDSAYSQSFISIELRGLEPSVGKVESIRLKYKAVGSVGEFVDYGTFDIKDIDLLVDTGSFTMTKDGGVQEKRLGQNIVPALAGDYYEISQNFLHNMRFYEDLGEWEKMLSDSVAVVFQASGSGYPWTPEQTFGYLAPKNKYGINVEPNTEYELSFSSFQGDYDLLADTTHSLNQVDVYISGTAGIVPDDISVNNTNEFVRHNKDNTYTFKGQIYGNRASQNNTYFGTYVGSVIQGVNTRKIDNKFSFITTQGGRIVPKFIIRSQLTAISDLKIKPRRSLGFTPNHYRLIVPLDKVQRNTEYLFKIEYVSPDNKKSNAESSFYGIVFDGGNYVFKGGDNVFSGSFSGDASGVTSPNFFNNDLTADDDRIHSMAANDLTINSIGTLTFVGNETVLNTDDLTFGTAGRGVIDIAGNRYPSTSPEDNFLPNGQYIKASVQTGELGGTAGWLSTASLVPDTASYSLSSLTASYALTAGGVAGGDTNFANTTLTLTGDRFHQGAGYSFTLTNLKDFIFSSDGDNYGKIQLEKGYGGFPDVSYFVLRSSASIDMGDVNFAGSGLQMKIVPWSVGSMYIGTSNFEDGNNDRIYFPTFSPYQEGLPEGEYLWFVDESGSADSRDRWVATASLVPDTASYAEKAKTFQPREALFLASGSSAFPFFFSAWGETDLIDTDLYKPYPPDKKIITVTEYGYYYLHVSLVVTQYGGSYYIEEFLSGSWSMKVQTRAVLPANNFLVSQYYCPGIPVLLHSGSGIRFNSDNPFLSFAAYATGSFYIKKLT
jgi:hypothetical protein